MKKTKEIARGGVLILLSLLIISTMALAQDINIVKPESVGISSEILANIDKLADQALKDKLLKGAVVLVARHGKICYFKAFGEADENKAMQKDAIFRLASMTKPITVAAIMQFWDQGRFELKDPVSKYIPEFKNLQVAELDSDGRIKLVPAKREVTIHDLLSFTGGISATYMNGLGPVHKYVADEYAKAGVQDLMSETYTKNLEQNVKALATCPLIFQPGESWCYNQGGMDTLAYLVEIFSGMPFDKYLEEHIFAPLKIKEMWFYPPKDQLSRIPAVYLNPGALEKATKEWAAGTGVVGPLYTFGKNKIYFSAGGGLHGTTIDYYKFAQMMLNRGELDGIRILSRQAIELMTTVQVGDGPQYRNLFSNNQWGYGVDIQASAKMSALNDWYGGPGSYGWRGYFSTMYFNDPIDDTVVMTMAQTPRHGYAWGCKVNQAAGAALLN